jgi:group I intron endonuclease
MIGIYKIQNIITGKSYIGGTSNMKVRWQEHRRSLLMDRHPNNRLQRAYNTYGIGCFDYAVIEECSKERLLERETYHLNSIDFDMLYNVNQHAYKVKKSEELFNKRISMYEIHCGSQVGYRDNNTELAKLFGQTREAMRMMMKGKNVAYHKKTESTIIKLRERMFKCPRQ